ncbi:MAG: RNA-binding protein [Hyphomonadaceae bacterium]
MTRERRCIVTREALPEEALVRFALGPEDVVTPDVAAKLPGRGVWVRAERKAVEAAVKKGAFARAFKQKAEARLELVDLTEALLARRCLDFLGMMKRAGALAMGFDQVDAAIRQSRPFALIEAADGAADGREKLLRLALGLWGAPPHLCGAFTAAEIGVALGRDHVVHALVLQERMALRWAAEIGRLSGFRAIVPVSWPDSWRSSPQRDAGAGRSDAGEGDATSS